MEGFKKYRNVVVNGKQRVLFVKANTRSPNPVLYIKHNGDMVTYKQFLKHKKNRGGSTDVTNMNYFDFL